MASIYKNFFVPKEQRFQVLSFVLLNLTKWDGSFLEIENDFNFENGKQNKKNSTNMTIQLLDRLLKHLYILLSCELVLLQRTRCFKFNVIDLSYWGFIFFHQFEKNSVLRTRKRKLCQMDHKWAMHLFALL